MSGRRWHQEQEALCGDCAAHSRATQGGTFQPTGSGGAAESEQGYAVRGGKHQRRQDYLPAELDGVQRGAQGHR